MSDPARPEIEPDASAEIVPPVVEDVAAEVEVEVAADAEVAPVVEDKPPAWQTAMQAIEDGLGEDLDPAALETVLAGLTVEAIKAAPASEKAGLRAMRAAFKAHAAAQDATYAERDTKAAAREKTIADREANFVRQRAAFLATATSPEARKAAEKPVGEAPALDPLDPKSFAAYLDFKVKEGLAAHAAAQYGPLTKVADEANSAAAYLELKERRAEMRDPEIEAAVNDFLDAREAAKRPWPGNTEDALDAVLGQRANAAAAAARTAAAKDRAESARHVARQTTTAAGSGPAIPDDVRQSGTIYDFLRDNPDAVRRIDQESR